MSMFQIVEPQITRISQMRETNLRPNARHPERQSRDAVEVTLKISRRDPSTSLGMTALVRFNLTKLAFDRRLRHVPTQIGKQIASRDQAKKLVAVHDNRD